MGLTPSGKGFLLSVMDPVVSIAEDRGSNAKVLIDSSLTKSSSDHDNSDENNATSASLGITAEFIQVGST
ncbi:hypothetical protein IQ254_07245 [Nodosilinea sp. LEGE 07088]|uniref:hypothetical protein n=1 Tax=Nodosilinea sp. LEGE 07088 TaxID=2777968 RepID=UPI0018825982|nr:hypothetical protein [Nodosilinea sp. LEGE 07088]MBE9136999.1 hypothetical protein [Nodosilinea sp. LEGE 07088]